MTENDWLTERFEESRDHLRSVAYRMLGSAAEADDAVQETWLRLHRADATDVANLRGWLTTVIARVCLDMLRWRKTRQSESLEVEVAAPRSKATDPAEEMLLARSVGLALLVVLETLSPAERVTFVLHDLFDLSFAEIAPIVGRTEEAARQLASRARRRVRGVERPPSGNLAQQYALVDAFLSASRDADFGKLVSMLDPNVVLRAPGQEIRGATVVAKFYEGRAQGAGPALIDGAVGIVVAPLGKLMMVILVTFEAGAITALDVTADPARLREVRIAAMDVA